MPRKGLVSVVETERAMEALFPSKITRRGDLGFCAIHDVEIIKETSNGTLYNICHREIWVNKYATAIYIPATKELIVPPRFIIEHNLLDIYRANQ